jgi:sulfonate dioxygenase
MAPSVAEITAQVTETNDKLAQLKLDGPDKQGVRTRLKTRYVNTD